MLEITEENAVARLVLTDAATKNALTFEVLDEITAACERLKDRADLRAVVLSGAGGTFCSGLNVSAFMAMAGQMKEIKTELRSPARADGRTRFQAPMLALADLPMPVIAVIEGHCYGAGLQLALGADFRIVAPDARLSIREAHWGMIPDMGITHAMGRLMRADVAKRLCMTGEVLSGRDADRHGLVTELAEDPGAAAEALIALLLARSPEAVRASKRLVDEGWFGGSDALALEGAVQADLIGSPNQMEAVMAGMQKRAPNFK